MWELSVYTILLGTILVAEQHRPVLGIDPAERSIVVHRRNSKGIQITKLMMDSVSHGQRWAQINGGNVKRGDMSYFRAYGRRYETYNHDPLRNQNFEGFTKRINVCRYNEVSVITIDECNRVGSRGLPLDFSFFVAEEEKPETTKVYSAVCHDEDKNVFYSTLSTVTADCSPRSRLIKPSIWFYVFKGNLFCKPLGSPPGGLAMIDRRSFDHGVRVKSVTYRCSYGYNLHGSATIICGRDGKWSRKQPTCKAKRCEQPKALDHGRPSRNGPYTFSDRITYKCDEGYRRYPSTAFIECQGDGRWTTSIMECRPVDCGYPGRLENGQINGNTYTYKKTVTFKCFRGFARYGARNSTCQSNGTWSRNRPKCERILCPPVGVIPNSRQHLLNRGLDSELIVQCNTGYKIEGNHTLKCVLKNGSKREAEWNYPPPVCTRITCTTPQQVENGKVFGNEFFYDSEVTYICNTGYLLEGNNRLTCTMNDWDGEPPSCRPISCRDPGVPRNGRRTGDSMNYGSVLQFECDAGYTMLGQQSITCGEGKAWSAARPQCEAIVCPPIGSPAHGSVELSGEGGSSAIFSCFPGYSMTGQSISRCLTSGHWSGTIPTCQACLIGFYKEGSGEGSCEPCPANSNTSSQASFTRRHCICDRNSQGPNGGPCEVVQCKVLTAPEHGEITSCSQNYRDTCSFRCDPGYVLSGYRVRACTKTGWSGETATCSACPMDTYKHMQGSSTCIPCPRHTTTGGNLGVSIDSCTCAPGYQGPPGGPCEDVNECATDNGGCNQACLNTPGSFRCSCSTPGYLMRADDKTCYMNQTCPSLEQEVGHGRTRCRYSEEENGYICYIVCDASHFFVSGINNYVTCGSDTGFEWSHRLVNRTAKIPACTREFFVDMNLPIAFKYRSEHSCNNLPIFMSRLETQIIQSVRDLNACGSFCEIRNFNATYTDSDGRGCEATVMMDIFLKNPDVNAIATECDPVCKRQNMRGMLQKTFVLKNSLLDLVRNSPQNLTTPEVEATTVITSSFSFGRPQMLCDPGKVLSKNRLCVPCDSGYYLPDRTLESCLPCPKGTYQMLQGQVACQSCDRFTTTVAAGSDHPAMCTVRVEEDVPMTTATSNAAAGDDAAEGGVDPVL